MDRPGVHGSVEVASRSTTQSSPTPGSGNLHLSTTSGRAQFSTSQATYPLKLLAPSPLPSQPPNLALAYTLAYGGGLVAGDVISLQITIDPGGALVLLTQGSTKVFKARPGIRPLSHQRVRHIDYPPAAKGGSSGETVQRMLVNLSKGSLALILPDSISPFRDSTYRQAQRFVLPNDGSASVLVLDWLNSGRGRQEARDEEGKGDEIWSMERYASTNEIWLDDKLVMRERMILDNRGQSYPKQSPARGGHSSPALSKIAKQLAPYHVYATILIYGPHLVRLLDHLRQLVDSATQYQLKSLPPLVWSYSDTSGDKGTGGVLRLSAKSVEEVRTWLRDAFDRGGIKDLVGEGVWPRII